jgi:hypothetical protein
MNGKTQYFLDGKFRVVAVEPNESTGSHSKKGARLQLTVVKRAIPAIGFSETSDFDKEGYRNYFISTRGFKEIKPERGQLIERFDRLLGNDSEVPIVPEHDVASSHSLDEVDLDERVLREIWARRGQPRFRNALLEVYGNRCCITGCAIIELLEAAHIDPHSDGGDYSVNNGLLLRADIHTLFDQHLLTVDEHREIHLSKSLMNSEYRKYHGEKVELPNLNAVPSSFAFGRRHLAFLQKEESRRQ